jgi:biotin transport system substrate-specific component
MNVFERVQERPRAYGLGATLVFAAATAITAQVGFRLPFTPVPVTFQVLAVVLSGMLLGSRLGALAQLEYLVVGLAGAPIFAHFTGGPAVLLGPSGGYLPGFVAGAYVTGLLFERARNRDIKHAMVAGMAGVAALYTLGVAWLAVWLKLTSAPFVPSALLLGVVPFIGVDAVKVAVASMFAAGAMRWKR